MTDVWRTKTTGTLLLTDWKGLPTRADNGDGWIYSQTTTFGLPHGMEQLATRDSTDMKLTMIFTLRDGSTRTFTYNVGLKVKYKQPISNPATRQDVRREIEVIVDIPDYPYLPDVPDDGNGAGFDAKVADWEDGGTIDMGTF
jgi:hypothetical protein